MTRADSQGADRVAHPTGPDRRHSAAVPATDGHHDVHSESGALPGEHPGRSRNPAIKVAGLAWLEFEKPDLDAPARFLVDFGFVVANRTPQALVLRAGGRARRASWSAGVPGHASSGPPSGLPDRATSHVSPGRRTRR